MKTLDRFLKLAGLLAKLMVVGWILGSPGTAFSQTTDDEEDRLKILKDPESIKKKIEGEKARPPLELFRTQVAPFDILPFLKPNHWSTLGIELRSNYNDYEGELKTSSIPLRGMPQELIYQRDARFIKTQVTKLGFQVMLPTVPREINVELAKPSFVRPDEIWSASLRQLEPHQMLILFLTKESTDAYATWNRYQALYPHGLDRADNSRLDKPRYYRLVLPLEPEKQPVSPHPLTWTTISHVIWDGLPPENLSPTQQQAMLDWLHWGGQLTLVGGATPSFSLLKDSFIGPYMPADDTGDVALLSANDLIPLAKRFAPPFIYSTAKEDVEESDLHIIAAESPIQVMGRYKAPVAITPAQGRPVAFNTLVPKPGAVGIPLGDSSEEGGGRLIAVERRVGRGRILMLGFSPIDPAMSRWKGLDTLIRRVVLRRPEESLGSRVPWQGVGLPPRRFAPLPGPDLSWIRYAARDFGTNEPRFASYRPFVSAAPSDAMGSESDAVKPLADDFEQATAEPVAEWLDTTKIPRIACAALEAASGIKIPNSRFVLKVLFGYLFALVPLNWLVCRYVFRRRELAWVIVPFLAIGCALLVERAAAYDLGYNSACDEIDVIEIFNEYPRAHVSRFGSLYSTGRTGFNLSFPNDQTALALPMASGRALRGEDSTTAIFQSYPSPTLRDLLVQPRSLGMYRSEQMLDLDGAINYSVEDGKRFVHNQGSLDLKDAFLIDMNNGDDRVETYLGTIAPGTRVEIPSKAIAAAEPTSQPAGLDPKPMLELLKKTYEPRPENRGEVRLVAWTDKLVPGRRIEPALDRERGFTTVIVHLAIGPAPSPDIKIYDSLRRTPDPGASNNTSDR